jgi:hypothetical protein
LTLAANADVRFGSLADIAAARPNVRFTPESGHHGKPGAIGGANRPRREILFEAVHVNAMIAVVEAEAVAAAPELRDWLLSLVAFARRAADRHVGVVFVIS